MPPTPPLRSFPSCRCCRHARGHRLRRRGGDFGGEAQNGRLVPRHEYIGWLIHINLETYSCSQRCRRSVGGGGDPEEGVGGADVGDFLGTGGGVGAAEEEDAGVGQLRVRAVSDIAVSVHVTYYGSGDTEMRTGRGEEERRRGEGSIEEKGYDYIRYIWFIYNCKMRIPSISPST